MRIQCMDEMQLKYILSRLLMRTQTTLNAVVGRAIGSGLGKTWVQDGLRTSQ